MTNTPMTPRDEATARMQVRRFMESAIRQYAHDADLPLTLVQVHGLARVVARSLTAAQVRVATTDRVLTGQQYEVLLGIMQGEECADTAQRMCISPHTVKTFRRLMYARLGVHTSGAAVAVAIASGLVQVGPQVAPPVLEARVSADRLRAMLARPVSGGRDV